MFGFKRSTYAVPDAGTFAASWWQFGERIFFFRERRVG
jgi:hypothetical protein